MSYRPIVLHNLSLVYPHLTCFEGFSKIIPYGSRIGIIGCNGSGKSSLLRIIQKLMEPTDGSVHIPSETVFGYVPQLIDDHETLSGGQRFNKALSAALAPSPTVLCLDEPTNHLDAHNRMSLMRMLQSFHSTLIVVSHDVELLRTCVDEIWHVENGAITCFSGTYDDYLREAHHETQKIHAQRKSLDKNLAKMRQAFQKEKERAAQSRRANAHENDRKLKGYLTNKGSQTSSKQEGVINEVKHQLNELRNQCRLPEVITPKFSLTSADLGSKMIVSVQHGACGYTRQILENITLSIGPRERIALTGHNGSGKTTLLKALQANPTIQRCGTWDTPHMNETGYLDQHYTTLDPEQSIFQMMQACVPQWKDADIRRHLNNFLLRKNEIVMVKTAILSGGEKVRASLALIAAKTPRLLLLDEITNNLDLATRQHVIEVLQAYPGTMVVISHDIDFLQSITIDTVYEVKDGTVQRGGRYCKTEET